MNREQAYYFKILLINGISDGYDEWLTSCLEAEDPLSDITIDLALCNSNISQTISLLHNYCSEQTFDEKTVCRLLREYLKEQYHSQKLSMEQVCILMSNFIPTHGSPHLLNFDIWGDMFYISDFYSIAEEGIISKELFDKAFHDYLDYETPVLDALGFMAVEPQPPKKTWLDKLKGIFKKQ
ncbi:MAG: hypothetical protein E7491_02085 [Ruminococcaceae bacterium]|nr:hypothetical protein [Oscillospiraceae bacterium]